VRPSAPSGVRGNSTAMVGRAAVCGEPREGLQCSEGGAHGDFVDDNT